ncbi:MAG: polymer-forming cytoskeletal protein [Deltaproteobacteria bacterium]|nr:MAG: polymer-forming cytoskeletal protein [Deltaproteobacteria bacterium]
MAQTTTTPISPPPPTNLSQLPTPSRGPELNALLGKGSQFEGKLLFEGTVRIDGKFSGEIVSTDTLIIGEGAEVKANVQVGTLVCLGDYSGDAKATKSIELKAPAKVRGTITTATVVIERGVFFEGTCKMDTTGASHSAPMKR